MTENEHLFYLVINSWIFKSAILGTLATLSGYIIWLAKDANKKINNAATKDELREVEKKIDKSKNEAFIYTENFMKIHEDKQKLELLAMESKIIETHKMVHFLYENEINRNKR